MENLNELKQKFIDAIEIICKDYEEKHKPEFKVPGWYKWEFENKEEIFYADRIYNNSLWQENNAVGWSIEYCRPATPAEIESHLRKICDEKYIGKKASCLCDVCGKDKKAFTICFFVRYEFDSDMIWYNIISNDNICVYKQGKFAEIIPDKKKRPKTEGEFRAFIIEILEGTEEGTEHEMERPYIESILDQYEF